MTRFSSLTLIELLDAFAASEPTPAGGSASALAAATGASLLIMAATLPKTRSGAADEAADLAAAAVRLRPIRDALVGLIDRDAEAYAGVIVAFRSTKGMADDERRHTVAAAMQIATEAPLETMRESARALHEAAVVARSCSRAAAGDVGAAVELLLAAMRGAGGSVDANLAALKDSEYVDRIGAERRLLEDQSVADGHRARAALQG
ncbi:MAG TPA: cyclodeaminase/cyclohydrolase family protein [Vicinamibacterales bacterium]|nr:cyclodeaminase/cyclohydrolase family protein [Vicinamibacterales bacterium]